MKRDFTFTVGGDVTAAVIAWTAHSSNRVLIESVRVFDVFDGVGVVEGTGPW